MEVEGAAQVAATSADGLGMVGSGTTRSGRQGRLAMLWRTGKLGCSARILRKRQGQRRRGSIGEVKAVEGRSEKLLFDLDGAWG